jgi:hypothetical protein
MTYQDRYKPRPQRPPEVDPLPPGSNPPRYREANHAGNKRNTGIIVAAVIALLVVIGLFVWAGSRSQQSAMNPPAQTTGIGGQDSSPPGPKK